MDKIAVVFPRFKIKSSEISDLWGNQLVRGYTNIRKLGFDEDTTTLAINAFHNLDFNPTRVFLVGDINKTVFLEACGIDGSVLEVLGHEDTAAINGLQKVLSEENSVLLVSSNPKSSDSRVNSILSGAAIAIHVSNSLEIVDFKEGKGSDEVVPKYSENELELDADINRLKAQIQMHEGQGKHIYNYVLMGNIKKTQPRPVISVQPQTGYAGPITPLLELVNWLSSGESGNLVSISAADQKQTSLIQLKLQNEIKIIKHDYSRYIPYNKLIQRQGLTNNPGEVAQGAYISTPVYQSNSAARYRLQANRCSNCQSIEFPPRKLCKECGKKTVSGPLLSKQGKLYTFTKILRGAAPTEFDYQQLIEGDYGVGIIEFPEGPKVITQLSDVNFDDLEIGDPMKMVFRKIYSQNGQPRYGYKFIKIS